MVAPPEFQGEKTDLSTGPKLLGIRIHRVKRKTMRIVIMTAITAVALPFMALGQTTEESQQTQGQTKDTQTTAPAKGKKMRPAQEQSNPQAKPETGTNARGQTNVKGRAHDVNRNQPAARSSTSETNVNTNQTTTVNKEEFRTRHTEVFSLGRHPKEFFVQRYGANHFRLIGNIVLRLCGWLLGRSRCGRFYLHGARDLRGRAGLCCN